MPNRCQLKWPVVREIGEMRALAARIDDLVLTLGPQIIHAHSPLLNGVPALWVARRHALPLVYEVRALWEDAAVDLGRGREGDLRYRTVRALETWLLRRADAVVTLCAAMREELASRGVPPEKLTVVPNAVSSDFTNTVIKSDEELLERFGLRDCTTLGFIGSFYHYEGLDLLIEALPRLNAVFPKIGVLLVGGGEEEQRLRQQAAALGVAEHVRFAGRVPHNQIKRYYSVIDYFIYPRRKIRLTDLVTPLKPLEAMGLGGLVLASDIGGHRELVRDGDTGLLFSPDNASALAECIERIAQMKERHAEMRLAARRFVETERVWEASAAAYAPIYNRVATRGGKN